jgi:hypothetical protein
MKKGTKIALGVGCGVLALGAVIVLVGGYFAMNYLERTLGESVKGYEVEGREFGKTADQQGCMTEAMKRSKNVGLVDFSGAIALSTFADACLENSRATPNFCDGVPSFWSMKESEWGADLCRKASIDPEKTACVHVTKRKHQFCSKPL